MQIGFLAWTWDAFDFYSVNILYKDLGLYFNKKETTVTLAATLVLLCRGFGAAIFGLASDRFGRKWPFIVDCTLLVFLEMCTGFCQSWPQFLAVRTLFGFAMGGLYGNAAATALEDLPENARGLFSGLFQSGYPFGILLATAFKASIVDTSDSEDAWRRLFWFGSGPPVLLIIGRLCLDENEAFQGRNVPDLTGNSLDATMREVILAIKEHWRRLTYLVLLLAGFNFIVSHTSSRFYQMSSLNGRNSHMALKTFTLFCSRPEIPNRHTRRRSFSSRHFSAPSSEAPSSATAARYSAGDSRSSSCACLELRCCTPTPSFQTKAYSPPLSSNNSASKARGASFPSTFSSSHRRSELSWSARRTMSGL